MTYNSSHRTGFEPLILKIKFKNPLLFSGFQRLILVNVSKTQQARYCPAWFVQAAELMVRLNLSLKQAAFEIGHPLDPDEAEKVSKRREFQEILRVERNKYYQMVANDPTRTKSATLGRMHVLADKLMAEGEHDKAALVLEKIGKMEGWSGNESNVTVFAGLTARDLAEARERIQGVLGSKDAGASTPADLN